MYKYATRPDTTRLVYGTTSPARAPPHLGVVVDVRAALVAVHVRTLCFAAVATRCTSVTKSMPLNWFRRLLRRRTALGRHERERSVRGGRVPSSAQRCSEHELGRADADSGWGRAVGRRIGRPPCSPTRRRWGGSTCGSNAPSRGGGRSRTRRRRARRVASRRASSHCAHTSARPIQTYPLVDVKKSALLEISDCALSSVNNLVNEFFRLLSHTTSRLAMTGTLRANQRRRSSTLIPPYLLGTCSIPIPARPALSRRQRERLRWRRREV